VEITDCKFLISVFLAVGMEAAKKVCNYFHPYRCGGVEISENSSPRKLGLAFHCNFDLWPSVVGGGEVLAWIYLKIFKSFEPKKQVKLLPLWNVKAPMNLLPFS
jgi:hypothetical protein